MIFIILLEFKTIRKIKLIGLRVINIYIKLKEDTYVFLWIVFKYN